MTLLNRFIIQSKTCLMEIVFLLVFVFGEQDCRDICHVPCNKSSGSKLFHNTTACMPEFAKMFNYATLCECKEGFMKDGDAETLNQLGFQFNTSMCVEVESCRPDCILNNHTFYVSLSFFQ